MDWESRISTGHQEVQSIFVKDHVAADRHDIHHVSHDRFDAFLVELQHAVENADFLVSKGLGSLTVKLKERAELSLFVGRALGFAKDVIQ
jgi:hypothetical protein